MSDEPSDRVPLSEIVREMRVQRSGRNPEPQGSSDAEKPLVKAVKAILCVVLAAMLAGWAYFNFWAVTLPKTENSLSDPAAREGWEANRRYDLATGATGTRGREDAYRTIKQQYLDSHPADVDLVQRFHSYYASTVERARKDRSLKESGYFRPKSDQNAAVPFGPEYSVDLVAAYLEKSSIEDREALTKYLTHFMTEAERLHAQHPDWPLRSP